MVGKERTKGKFRHNPLADDLLHDKFAHSDPQPEPREAPKTSALPTAAMTKKVMHVARRQLEEEDAMPGEEGEYEGEDDQFLEEAEEEFEDEEDVVLEYDDAESQVSEVESFADLDRDLCIGDEEQRLLEKFQPATTVQTRNLADIIMAKIKDHAATKEEPGDMDQDATKIDKRVVKIYSAIGQVLKQYTAGKIPKAFKVLPHIQNWEQLLLLTRPHEWSPHATYAATRIFASGLNERMAQRFYSAFLLPIIHTSIESNKKLHPSQYQAVRKALFKPVAFYKGFLLPLVTEAEFECTLKEALIIGSILQKCHLPPIPTAVVLVKMCEVPFSSAQCVFLRILIDKKMALPYQCIDAIVLYFHRFCHTHPSSEKLPVLWHQMFLLFVAYYKADFNVAQVDLLKQVCSKHFHQHITPEVRRELAAISHK